jgi:transcriptional regulator with XRE-family HTH domain
MFYVNNKFVYKTKLLLLMSNLKSKRRANKMIINRLAAVLKEEGVSNKALAAELGYEETTVSKWATNTIQPPLSTFLRIALTINRDLKDFFISSKDIDGEEKKKMLKELAIIAEKGKRTGKGRK